MSDASGLSKRFWEKVQIRGPKDCWPWLAMVSVDGHGKFQVGRSCVTAHRVAYELSCGAIPTGMLVRHACDQNDCVNPAHLTLGSIQDNNADRKARGGYEPAPSWAHGVPNGRLAARVQQRRGPEPRDPVERLMESFVVAPNGCWEWQKAKLHYGHGAFVVGGKTKKAHRVAYELLVGPIPEGLQVLHQCDNPSCINPEHLRVGTHADNMNDMRVRNRAARGKANHFGRVLYRGDLSPRSVLTEDAVREIRASEAPYLLKGKYGVSKATISHVLARRTWTHVE